MSSYEKEAGDILEEALRGLRGLGGEAIQKIRDDYAPIIARITAADSQEEARSDYEDALANMGLDAAGYGIDAESVEAQTISKFISLGIKFAFAALPLA